MISAFLPSDLAPEHELMQVGETEAYALQYGVDDLSKFLLQQPFNIFLDNLTNNKDIRTYIDTFLRFSDRPTDRLAKIVYFDEEEENCNSSLFDNNIAAHQSIEGERRSARKTLLYGRIFNIFKRLVDKNEYETDPRFGRKNESNAGGNISYGDYIYNNWIVSAPQILDFICIYGYADSKVATIETTESRFNETKFIFNQLLVLQPNYVIDLNETLESTAGPLLELIERISNSVTQPAGTITNEKISDWIAYLLDILTTLWCFVSVCENNELLNSITINLLPYFDKIVRTVCQILLDLGGNFESIAMIQSLCVALGADKPLSTANTITYQHVNSRDEVVLLPKHIEEELANVRKKTKEEIKEENDLKAVYASIIAQYDEYEDEEDDYVSGAFSLERQSSVDGPEIIEETTNNNVNVAIVRDSDGSKKEVLVPNRNKLVKAPRNTRRQGGVRGRGKSGTSRGRGRGRGGVNTSGGSGRGGRHTQNKRGQKIHHAGARGGTKKSSSKRGGKSNKKGRGKRI
jgi:hypothetical protein